MLAAMLALLPVCAKAQSISIESVNNVNQTVYCHLTGMTIGTPYYIEYSTDLVNWNIELVLFVHVVDQYVVVKQHGPSGFYCIVPQ